MEPFVAEDETWSPQNGQEERSQGDQIGSNFRLLGRLLSLGNFLKITEVAKID
jgi:hypothetical protein